MENEDFKHGDVGIVLTMAMAVVALLIYPMINMSRELDYNPRLKDHRH